MQQPDAVIIGADGRTYRGQYDVSKHRAQIVHVQSAARDRTAYPTASRFSVPLDFNLRNVTSITLNRAHLRLRRPASYVLLQIAEEGVLNGASAAPRRRNWPPAGSAETVTAAASSTVTSDTPGDFADVYVADCIVVDGNTHPILQKVDDSTVVVDEPVDYAAKSYTVKYASIDTVTPSCFAALATTDPDKLVVRYDPDPLHRCFSYRYEAQSRAFLNQITVRAMDPVTQQELALDQDDAVSLELEIQTA